MDETKVRDPISDFETLDEIAEFWDKHSTADYDDLTHPVQFEVKLRERGQRHVSITLLPDLGETLEALAQARGVSVETLVNVWLTEKVRELA
ncbi:MAG TPA: CopG family antitoxin [Anaerolineae bacterium]|nr:CopG family antitoxin [Anaerolineae bacterium]